MVASFQGVDSPAMDYLKLLVIYKKLINFLNIELALARGEC